MKHFILTGCLIMLFINVFSQRFSGKVMDENEHPIKNAAICIGNSSDYHPTNKNGEFKFFLPKKRDLEIKVYAKGYETMTINHVDTIFHPINIIMREDSTSIEYPNRNDFGYITSLQLDFLKVDFNSFAAVLGEENIKNMNELDGYFNIELALWYRGFNFAINMGFAENASVDLDTLKADYRMFTLGTHFGYNIINTRHFLITPKIGIRWYKYRMDNYDNDNRIPLEQYVNQRDLDIRFNHLMGFGGLNLTYKFHYVHFPMAIGVYGGYIFKLNDKPWVYSKHNRLTTDYKVKFNDFSWGVYWAFILN